MEKAKLGITVNLLAASIYFFGIISVVPMVILAGYVLLLESDGWLRKSAVKAVGVLVAFELLTAGVGLLRSALSFLNVLLGWLPGIIALNFPLSLDSLLIVGLSILKVLALFCLGYAALTNKKMASAGPIDALVDKNIPAE
jgi:hypothetical protein